MQRLITGQSIEKYFFCIIFEIFVNFSYLYLRNDSQSMEKQMLSAVPKKDFLSHLHQGSGNTEERV